MTGTAHALRGFLASGRARVRASYAKTLQWLTRARLIVVGHEELTAIVFWAAIIGIAGAFASMAFRECTHLFELMLVGRSGSIVEAAMRLHGWHRAIVPVIGGLAAGLVIQYGTAWVAGRRSIDYMEAVAVGDGVIAARPTLIRSVSSLLTIASGGSIGREGPMVQLSALIGSKVAQLGKAPVPRRRLLVACGAAAGIASAYNAPIAGALFVAEIVMGSFAMESFGPLLVSAVSADATIHRLLGYGPVFVVPPVHFGENWELILYAVFGVLLGHLAPPFLALLAWSKARFAALPCPLYLKFAIGGLIVGLISVLLPEVWGNGYSVVDAILHDRLLGWMLLAVLLAKVASTASTVGSGAVGGVFTPTLFIGAAVGALTGSTLRLGLPHMTSTTGAFAVVGMGGFLAATTHAPLTSVLMIFEMTLDHQVVLPLILACVTAHYVAKVYRGGASIYRESLVPSTEDPSMWQLRTIASLIRPAAAIVEEATPVQNMLQKLPRRPVHVVYIVNADRELVASIDPRKVFTEMKQGLINPRTPARSVSSPLRSTLTPDMSLTAALDVFLRENETVLPVIAGAWRNTLLGEISRHDLLLAVQDRMAEAGPP
ncbi:MAG TPA: ClcB-like voltage-gated chloride channel protein [Steroidobacteraceae bacterium]|nr:ClcB-like voltage-gated chloride channel protein [Steroidobacteraceae bacterium]